MGNSRSSSGDVPDPRTAKTSSSLKTKAGLNVATSAVQGHRPYQEDRHCICELASRRDHTFLSIFDGHNGAGAAHYASGHLVAELERSPCWRDYLAGGATDPHLLGRALAEAFFQLDAALRVAATDRGGCTSVAAVITPTHIVCANAGDSRCVLGTNERTKALSEDHKPTDDGERRRIEAAGGKLQWKRVDGDLAVSRAFGDFQFKARDDLGPEEQKVTCDPDIAIHERTREDEMLVLACDGLWDVMSSTEVVVTVRELFMAGPRSMVPVAEELLDLALRKGSKDNITVVVARLSGPFSTCLPSRRK